MNLIKTIFQRTFGATSDRIISIRLKEQKDEEEADEEQDLPTADDFELLKGYIPTPVLRYLLDKNPLGI